MSDKSRKLEDIKREGKEQTRRAVQMKEEAKRHKIEVDTLDQASATLKEGRAELESAEANNLIRDLDRAKDSAKKEIDRLKAERERLLGLNENMADKVKGAQQRNRKVGMQLGLIRSAAQGEVAGQLDEISNGLKGEWNNLTLTDSMLSSARLKLQLIKID